MELTRGSQALDGGDAASLVHQGERQAGINAASVDNDRAGSALAVIATFFSPGKMQVLAKGVEQRRPGVNLKHTIGPVHSERHARNRCRRRRRRAPARRIRFEDVCSGTVGRCRCHGGKSTGDQHVAPGHSGVGWLSHILRFLIQENLTGNIARRERFQSAKIRRSGISATLGASCFAIALPKAIIFC
jgi:hypothetical protein